MATVLPNVTSHKFKNLHGNTTYRVSLEAFAGDESIIYASTLITTSLTGKNNFFL